MTPQDVAPWWTFFLLCARRQFKLLGRDTELLQGRLMQARRLWIGWAGSSLV